MSTCQLNQYINIFTPKNWETLESITASITNNSSDTIKNSRTGDSRNEPVRLRVARFITRKNQISKIENEPYCSQLLTLFQQTQFLSKVKKHTGIHNLQILRLQLNLMDKGSYVGIHTDQENDPSFLITAILRTKSDFLNGELVLYEKTKRMIMQENHTIFLMDATVEHEVLPVTQGYRNSYIVVLGT